MIAAIVVLVFWFPRRYSLVLRTQADSILFRVVIIWDSQDSWVLCPDEILLVELNYFSQLPISNVWCLSVLAGLSRAFRYLDLLCAGKLSSGDSFLDLFYRSLLIDYWFCPSLRWWIHSPFQWEYRLDWQVALIGLMQSNSSLIVE